MPSSKKTKRMAVSKASTSTSKKPKAPPPPAQPTLMEDGFTVHPERLIHRADPAAVGREKVAGLDLVS